jgi:hypothetical protein
MLAERLVAACQERFRRGPMLVVASCLFLAAGGMLAAAFRSGPGSELGKVATVSGTTIGGNSIVVDSGTVASNRATQSDSPPVYRTAVVADTESAGSNFVLQSVHSIAPPNNPLTPSSIVCNTVSNTVTCTGGAGATISPGSGTNATTAAGSKRLRCNEG